MRIRRKTQRCLNCGHSLNEVYTYCPNCGQENNDHNVSLRVIIAEFFSNYLGVDSRFWSTMRPFLIKPGFLTNRFNEGKRKAYVHPVRLYLVVSLLYFFVLGLVGKQLGSWQEVLESTKDDSGLNVEFTGPEGEKITPKNPLAIMEMVDSAQLIEAEDELPSFVLNGDTVRIDTTGAPNNNMVHLLTVMRDLTLSDSISRDSLGFNAMPMREYRQMRKIAQSDLTVFVGSTIQNIPVMMFFMIPIFGALLRLWYIRRKILYIQHVIHGLHLHAFAYWIFSIATVLMIYVSDVMAVRGWIGLIAFGLVSVYSYLSFLRVYQQGPGKTLLKFLLQGMVYLTELGVSAGLALTVTFYLYCSIRAFG